MVMSAGGGGRVPLPQIRVRSKESRRWSCLVLFEKQVKIFALKMGEEENKMQRKLVEFTDCPPPYTHTRPTQAPLLDHYANPRSGLWRPSHRLAWLGQGRWVPLLCSLMVGTQGLFFFFLRSLLADSQASC